MVWTSTKLFGFVLLSHFSSILTKFFVLFVCLSENPCNLVCIQFQNSYSIVVKYLFRVMIRPESAHIRCVALIFMLGNALALYGGMQMSGKFSVSTFKVQFQLVAKWMYLDFSYQQSSIKHNQILVDELCLLQCFCLNRDCWFSRFKLIHFKTRDIRE